MKIGISISIPLAEQRFEEAMAIAQSDFPVPEQWSTLSRQVGESTRGGDTVVLGCALLAKACDSRIDPFVVKLGETERGYHMRGIADHVLAPARDRYGFDLGSQSANPTNGSTWLKPRTLHDIVTREKGSFEFLLSVLAYVDRLDEQEALRAFAAWLRERFAVALKNQPIIISDTESDLAQIVTAAKSFVLEDPERGGRGQALAAAALSLIWADVRTGKINDPSRHWPGDVHVFQAAEKNPMVAIEVKQREVTEDEVWAFTRRCANQGIKNVMYVALSPGQQDGGGLDASRVARELDCVFTWIYGVEELIFHAFAWSPRGVKVNIRNLARGMVMRMVEVGLPVSTQKRWAELTRSSFVE
ncbi:restriction endonuclease, SacI family [Micromonospora sp. NPDC049645]|uniref:restriction endonuclease, SacI family n=1 Tax=Micromonospora sp. NPDC049645 TaxID=3155508 RepID=UPI00342FDEC6